MTDVEVRWTNLTWLIASDGMLNNSTKWLDRLSDHMKSSEHLLANDVDNEFLSKFHVTATCPDGQTDEWDEYIEPLTIHARQTLSDFLHVNILPCTMENHTVGVEATLTMFFIVRNRLGLI